MMFIIIRSLIIYLILAGVFTIIFGLLVLNDEDKWYISILKMLFMPFLVIIGFVLAILEEKKRKTEIAINVKFNLGLEVLKWDGII